MPCAAAAAALGLIRQKRREAEYGIDPSIDGPMAAAAGGGVRVLGEVEASPQDDRSYRAIELGNKLQVRRGRGGEPGGQAGRGGARETGASAGRRGGYDEKGGVHVRGGGGCTQALLIHDKDTDKASCAMDVAVGSLFDGDIMGRTTRRRAGGG